MTSQFNTSIVGVVVLSTLLSPFAVFAQTTSNTVKPPKATFCTLLATNSQKLLNGFDPKMDGRTDKRDENEKERLTKLEELRKDRDDKHSTDRDDGQAKRNIRYDALLKKADTDAKKVAVTAYRTAVDTATTKHIVAVDAAVKAYRDGMDVLVKTRLTTLDTGAATLKSAIDAAIAQAKTDCANNITPAAARAKLVAAAKAAQNIFKANRSDVAIKAELLALTAARKKAVEAATTAFKADVTKATLNLKTAFGVK